MVGGCNVVITTAAVARQQGPGPYPEAGGRSDGAALRNRRPRRGTGRQLRADGGAGETVDHGGVRILGPANLPATVPYHASEMYGRNLAAFLTHLLDDAGRLKLDPADEITAATLVTSGGRVVGERVLEAMGRTPAGQPGATAPEASAEAKPLPSLETWSFRDG